MPRSLLFVWWEPCMHPATARMTGSQGVKTKKSPSHRHRKRRSPRGLKRAPGPSHKKECKNDFYNQFACHSHGDRPSVNISESFSLVTMVIQPVGGGPIYWGLRTFFQAARHRSMRYGRLMDMNWDFARACMNGTPKFSYDPSVNSWRTGVDNEHWNGPGGMVWSSVSMNFMWWSFWAFWVYFTIARWYVNGKVDTFSKWKKTDG